MSNKFYDISNRLINIKTGLSSAISGKGIETSNTSSFKTIKENIDLIQQSEGNEIKLEGTELILDADNPIVKGEIVAICGELEEVETVPKFYPSKMTFTPSTYLLPFTSDGEQMFMTRGSSYNPAVYRINKDMTVDAFSLISDLPASSSSNYIVQLKFDPTSNYTRLGVQMKTSVKDNIYIVFNVAVDNEAKTVTLTRIPFVCDSFIASTISAGIAFDSQGKLYLSTAQSDSSKEESIYKFEYRDGQYVETGEIIPYTKYSTSSTYSIKQIMKATDDCIYIETGTTNIRNVISKRDRENWQTVSLNAYNIDGLSGGIKNRINEELFLMNDRVYMTLNHIECIMDITDIDKGISSTFGPFISNDGTALPIPIDDRFFIIRMAKSSSGETYHKQGIYVIDTLHKGFFMPKKINQDYNPITIYKHYDFGEYKLVYRKPSSSSSAAYTYDLCRFNVKLTAELPTQENKARRMYTGYALEDSKDGKVKVVMMDNLQSNTNFINIYDTIDEGMLIDEDMMIEEGLIFEDVLINDMMDEE